MATTQNTYTGNGSTTDYSITFEYLKDADVKVTLDHVATTAFTFPNATTLRFTTAPGNNVAIRIFRDTDVDAARFIYSAGSSIKAAELNENADQTLYGLQETANTDDITDQAVTTAKLRDGAVTTAKFANLSITTAQLVDSGVTTAKIAADAVNGTKIADNSINSEHYVDGSIDTDHIADAQVTTAKIADDAVTAAKLANTAVTAGSYTAADITVDAQGRVTAASSGAIGTSEITDAAVTTAKITDANVTTAKIADSAITNAKLADAELVELATMGGNTASALADLTQAEVQILDGATVTTAELNILDGVTATATELNQLDGNTLKTTGTDFTSTSQFPAASEIDARITARIDPLGGFEAIADEDSFPATAPPVGTVISIANANSLAVNSSGVGAGTRAGGSDAVVINGFPSGFNSTSLDDGIGLLVIATSTAHTYDFHRVVAKNEDVRQLSSDINDFKARYRIGSSNPTTDNDAGDLFFNTGTSKMLVRNAGNSAWQEVQAVGDFFINTISSSSGTGGGSATFNGSAYRFTLSNAPITAQQLLVSINGVVQKPNSGTSQPSEGFVLNGADIIFSAAPASGAAGFFITIGSSVGIGTPSDNTVSTAKLVNDSVTNAKIADDSIDSEHYVDGSIDTAHIADSAVTSAKIADGTIVNADVNASAAIAGTKVSPNFGSQNVLTTGSAGIGTASPTDSLNFTKALDVNGTSGAAVYCRNNGSATNFGAFAYYNSDTYIENKAAGNIFFKVNGSERLRIDSSGRVGIKTSANGSLYSGGDDLVLGDGGASNQGMTIYTGNSQQGIIAFADGTSGAAQQYAGYLIYDHSADGMLFATGGSEKMRIDSSGRVGIGTATADGTLHVHSNSAGSVTANSGADDLVVENNGDAGISILTADGNNATAVMFGCPTQTVGAAIRYNHNSSEMALGPDQPGAHLRLNSGDGIEAARLDSSGRLLLGATAAVSGADANGKVQVSQDVGSNTCILVAENTASSGNLSCIRARLRNSAPNSVFSAFLQCDDSGANRATIRSNGGLANYSANNANLSDRNAKKDISAAANTWDRVKEWEIVNYRYNDQPDDADLSLGVIAQQVNESCPEVVTVFQEAQEATETEPAQEERLGVKEQQMHWMAIKALQEAIAKIETLETQNASLEARLTALEGGS